MELTLNVKPRSVGVRPIMDPQRPEGPAVGYELQLFTDAMTITVGPFPLDHWQNFAELIGNPETALASQEARSRIVRPDPPTGAQAPDLMRRGPLQ